MGRDDDHMTGKKSGASAAEGRTAVKRKPSGGSSRTAAGSRTLPEGSAVKSGRPGSGGSRTSPEGSAAKGGRPAGSTGAAGSRSASADRAVSGNRTGAGPKPAARKKAAAGRAPSGGRKKASGRSAPAKGRSAADRRDRNGQWEGTGTGASRRDEERARRKAARERKVRRQKITMLVSSCIILLSVVFVVLFCLPSVKTAVRIFQGDRYRAKEDYVSAQSAYEKAVEADPASAKAYHYLAYVYEKQEKFTEAEQLLYTGWEKTEDEFLLQYYCTVVLNQAVDEINAGNCTLATVDKCVRALEHGVIDEKALELLGVCHDRLFQVKDGNETCTLFYDEDAAQDLCSYAEYEQLLRRMYAACQARPSEESKNILRQYAVIDMPHVRISVPHMDSYAALLTEISSLVSDVEITETIACLARAKEIEDYFGRAFDEFAAGNYAYGRELVSEEAYQKIRDDFITENSGYWEGSISIPVSREQMALHRKDGGVKFSFLSDEDYGNRQGIILISGAKQEDDGVQRSAVTYRPAVEEGATSSTEYTMQYLYSNVKIKGKYVPQMNYRFDTRVTTPEGVTTTAIGDWGGENEWEIDY